MDVVLVSMFVVVNTATPMIHMSVSCVVVCVRSFVLDTGLTVTSISPARGSMLGGNHLTITGAGFGSSTSFVSVSLVDVNEAELVYMSCVPITVSPHKIECMLTMAAYLLDTTDAVVEVGIPWVCLMA
jgi:hypothetical protein